MHFPDKKNGVLSFPRFRTLLKKIIGVLRIWAVLSATSLVVVFLMPAQACKPFFIAFLLLNGLCLILIFSRFRAFNRLTDEIRFLLSHTRNMMWTMDSQLMITGICGNVKHITGKDGLALMNTTLSAFLPGNALEEFNGLIRKNKAFSMECTICTDPQKPLPVQIQVTPIHGLGQDAFQGIIQDVSDQVKIRHLEKKLKDGNKLKNLGVIAGSVAHDLNNILAGMATFPEILLLDNTLPTKVRESLTIIKDSGQKASTVVGDLLTISRGIKADRQILNINAVIQRFITAPEFKKIRQSFSQTCLDIDLEPELLNISGSYIHIERTIMNLLVNAFEQTATMENGDIVLSTANFYVNETCTFNSEIKPVPGEYVMLMVSDNGPGIPQGCLDNIFDPFFTSKELGLSGTGLGLTVVLNTVEDHRGDIQVASSSKGTRFTLLFPAVRAEIPAAAQPVSLEEITGNAQTILVVDDLSTQRKIAEAILTRLNYRVFSVADGLSAIEFIKQTPVDLILLDVFLGPGLSGLEALEQIREINPGQKAIIASGHSESEEVLKAQELGKDAFVKKPFTVMEMGIAVKEELDG